MADDVQEFYSAGTWWWEKPSRGGKVRVFMSGAGGSGGTMGADAPGSGGGGGGGLYTAAGIPLATFAAQDRWQVVVGGGGDSSGSVWTASTEMPDHYHTSHQSHTVSVGTDVYINVHTPDGDGGDPNAVSFFRFDTLTGTWMHLTRWHWAGTYGDWGFAHLLVIDGDVYAMGQAGDYHLSRYDADTDTWTNIYDLDPETGDPETEIPPQLWLFPYGSPGGAYDVNFLTGDANFPHYCGVGDRLYVYGYGSYHAGSPGGGEIYNRIVWSWQPSTNTWTQVADAPDALDQAGAQTAAGFTYIGHNVGTGYTCSDGTDLLVLVYAEQEVPAGFWRYHPASNTWTVLASPGTVDPDSLDVLDATLWDSSLCADESYAFLLGGYNDFGDDHNWVEVYDRSADTWTMTVPLPDETRTGVGSAVITGTVWVFSGTASNPDLDDFMHSTLYASVSSLVSSVDGRDGGTSRFAGLWASGGHAGAGNGPSGGGGGYWGTTPGTPTDGTALVSTAGGGGSSPPDSVNGGQGGVGGLVLLPLPSPMPQPVDDWLYWTQINGRGGQGGGQTVTTVYAYSSIESGNLFTNRLSWDLPSGIPSGSFMLTIAASNLLALPDGPRGTVVQSGIFSDISRPFSAITFAEWVGPDDSGRHVEIDWPVDVSAPGGAASVAKVAIFANVGVLNNVDAPGVPNTVHGGPFSGTVFTQTFNVLQSGYGVFDFAYGVSAEVAPPQIHDHLEWFPIGPFMGTAASGPSYPGITLYGSAHMTTGPASMTWRNDFSSPFFALFGFGSFGPNQFGAGQPGGNGGVVIVTSGEDTSYLRMTQRDDGRGVNRAPRVASHGTSTQSTRAPRVGNNNRYR